MEGWSKVIDELREVNLPGREIRRGKVRDIIPNWSEEYMIMVATDRISAFDIVMPTLIPGKGRILTEISDFWFRFFSQIPNHRVGLSDAFKGVRADDEEWTQLRGRAMACRRAKVIPIEFIVRGYAAGSYWKKIKESFGEAVRYKHCEELDEPIFTPSTKAEIGQHDEDIEFEQCVDICEKHLEMTHAGAGQLMTALMHRSIEIYRLARSYAITKGIIIADTKFEFGVVGNTIILIDELLTPDSSRFWSLKDYEPGHPQNQYDKQILRDYLQGLCDEGKWDKTDPAPELPDHLVSKIKNRYEDIWQRLTQ